MDRTTYFNYIEEKININAYKIESRGRLNYIIFWKFEWIWYKIWNKWFWNNKKIKWKWGKICVQININIKIYN